MLWRTLVFNRTLDGDIAPDSWAALDSVLIHGPSYLPPQMSPLTTSEGLNVVDNDVLGCAMPMVVRDQDGTRDSEEFENGNESRGIRSSFNGPAYLHEYMYERLSTRLRGGN
jgi:hypothetical protein